MIYPRDQRILHSSLILATLVLVGVCFHLATFALDYGGTAALLIAFPLAALATRSLLWNPPKILDLFKDLRWYHGLWLLVFLSGLVFRVREVESIRENPLDYWAIYRAFLMAIVGLVLIARLAHHRTAWMQSLFGGLIGLLAAHSIFAVASTVWSVSPSWTLYKSIEYLVDVVLIAAIISRRSTIDLKPLFNFTWLLLTLLLSSVWIGVFLWPEAAARNVGLIGIQISGVIPAISSNDVGEFGAVLGIVVLCRLLVRGFSHGAYPVLLLFFVATMVFSQCRSAVVAFLFGSIFVVFCARRFKLLGLILVTFLGVWISSLWEWLSAAFQRGQDLEQMMSLTGRVEWWIASWEYYSQNFLGAGAYAAGRFGVLANLGATFTSTVHNTWLEVTLGTGPLGVISLLLCLLGSWYFLLRTAMRRMPTCLHLEAIGVLFILTVRSIFASHLIWHPPLLFLLVLGYTELLRREDSNAR
jgi:hypothetical protein